MKLTEQTRLGDFRRTPFIPDRGPDPERKRLPWRDTFSCPGYLADRTIMAFSDGRWYKRKPTT